MKTSLLSDLAACGHLATSARMHKLGHTRASIDSAIRRGEAFRPVKPWLATSLAERDAVVAIMHRGALTNASALGSFGVWRALDRRIHVLVPQHSAGGRAVLSTPLALFTQPAHPTEGLVRHWGKAAAPVRNQEEWRVSLVDALASFARTQPQEHFIAALDNALHTGALRPSALPVLISLLPARLAGTTARIDARAESGTESVARLRFSSLGRRIDIQVEIGPFRVDLLIDGWLVIELDSEEWHADSRVDDSRRDTWLTARGYRVLRFDYQEVMFEWDHCLGAVLDMLRYPPAARPRSS